MTPDFLHGHISGLLQLRGEAVPLSAEGEATDRAMQADARLLARIVRCT